MSPDAVGTLASRLERDWPYGARFVALMSGPAWGSAVAECGSSDGGRWFIGCGRYGESFVYADTRELVCAALEAGLAA